MTENNGLAAIREKIVLSGELRLESPLRISGGEVGERETDSYVLKNRLQEPIIPGSSLAGVLRAAYKSLDLADGKMPELLFGSERNVSDKKKSVIRQSAVCVSDITLKDFEITIRDGVAINPLTGCAINGSKHNYEAVTKGARGELKIEITLRREHEDILSNIEEAAKNIAKMLTQGLRFGSLTGKGFGLTKCSEIKINRYDFTKPQAVKTWLLKEDCASETITSKDAEIYAKEDFVVDMDLTLDASMLIRQATDEKRGELKIKAEQIQHKNNFGKTDYYIVPGTSIKGVLRHQAQKILQSVGQDVEKLEDLMGSGKSKTKSRFIVNESYINPENAYEYIQPRTAIDRFTGGNISSKLFGEKPIRQNKEGTTAFSLHFEIKPAAKNKQKNWEIGLALFLIKDIATGKVTFGAEKSIGRGRVKAVRAVIHYEGDAYEIDDTGKVTGSAENPVERLENLASCFLKDTLIN